MTPSALAQPGDHPLLRARLDDEQRQQRRVALRALLLRPLLSAAADEQALALVRRHAPWLRQWLARNAGWSLQVDSEVARLRKVAPETADGSRPLRDASGKVPFSRRRYALLCLALAALERSERQTALGHLAEAVLRFAAGDLCLKEAGVQFDLTDRQQRRDLVQVIQVLLDWRVLHRVHGSEEQFVSQKGDALYNIDRSVLAALLSVTRGPSVVEAGPFDDRLRQIVEELSPDTEDGRRRQLRWRLTRRLLEDPVVYFDGLTEEERSYLASQRSHMLRQINEATGLFPEVRAEGIALVDEGGGLTDLALPEEGTDGHVTLLIAEYLAAAARRPTPGPIAEARIEAHVASLAQQYGKYWRRDARQPGAEQALTERTLTRLAALGLVKRTDGAVVPLPAIARFALARHSNAESAGRPVDDR